MDGALSLEALKGHPVLEINEDTARAHRRQFLIAPTALDLGPFWKCAPFGNSYFCHDKDLKVTNARDADGASWLLLGHAVETDATRPAPADALTAARTADIADLTFSWSGRWLLIGETSVLTDACALLGCLHTKDSEGRLWISSSPTLLAKHALGDEAEIGDHRKLLHERGVSWFPPPRTRFAQIRRLLPSQKLDLRDGHITARSFLPSIEPVTDYDAALSSLNTMFRNAMAGIREITDGPLWLGLTAGYDSRLMLAIAQKAKIDIHPYTRLTPRMSVADRILSPVLAEMAGFEHIASPDQPTNLNRNSMFTEHTAGHVSRGDANPFLAGVRAHMQGTTFGGHGFALASGFSNWHELPDRMPDPAEATRLFLDKTREPKDSTAAEGLNEWFEWATETPHANLDWRDRLFLEQRQTGWLAAKEQVYDMEALERFPILNSARIYACLLSIDRAKRRGSNLQKDLIERIAPDLAEVPFNPPDSSFLTRAPHRVFQRRWFFMSRRLSRRLGLPSGVETQNGSS